MHICCSEDQLSIKYNQYEILYEKHTLANLSCLIHMNGMVKILRTTLSTAQQSSTAPQILVSKMTIKMKNLLFQTHKKNYNLHKCCIILLLFYLSALNKSKSVCNVL